MKVDSYEHFFLYSDRNTLDSVAKKKWFFCHAGKRFSDKGVR